VALFTIVPPTASIITNGSFEFGASGWTFYTNTRGGFQTVPDVSGQSAQVTINQAGSNIQLFQFNLTLSANTNYRLTFMAKSSTGHAVNVSVFKHTPPYSNYGLMSTAFGLTQSWQQYTVDFTTGNFSGTVSDARLMFQMAANAVANDVYWFDDVSLAPR
jgi:hypothetical protein